ncbi:MAG TPA: hypothetical protein VGI03_03430 [Verrucomicrobiae bacterium]|jgi:hypothetical protein
MNTTMPHLFNPVALSAITICVLLILSSLFVLSLVKAITHRTSGWIIATVFSGIPCLVLCGAFFIGLFLGLTRMASGQTQLGQPSRLLTAAMTPISGKTLGYQISFPGINNWQIYDAKPPFDFVYHYYDAYVGILPEGIGHGSPESACELIRKRMQARVQDFSATTPTPVIIDSRRWLTYDVNLTTRGIKLEYRYYVYSDNDYTIQIVTWTTPKHFDSYAPLFDRVANSFKFPQ